MASPLAAIALLALPLTAFSGGTTPEQLPRGLPRMPIGLTAGFTSEDPGGGPAPELNQIEIRLSRRVSLQTADVPLCRERLLFKTTEAALSECRGSLVGRGAIVSDIPTSAYSEQTVRVEGTIQAFYGLAEGRGPMILARVETGEPMPLVYVIPFAIERLPSGRTSLVAHRMRNRRGKCARGHPNCFADPYGVNGIYARVASMQLTLRGTLRSGGRRMAFATASCAPYSVDPEPSFPLERIELAYADGRVSAGTVAGACRHTRVGVARG